MLLFVVTLIASLFLIIPARNRGYSPYSLWFGSGLLAAAISYGMLLISPFGTVSTLLAAALYIFLFLLPPIFLEFSMEYFLGESRTKWLFLFYIGLVFSIVTIACNRYSGTCLFEFSRPISQQTLEQSVGFPLILSGLSFISSGLMLTLKSGEQFVTQANRSSKIVFVLSASLAMILLFLGATRQIPLRPYEALLFSAVSMAGFLLYSKYLVYCSTLPPAAIVLRSLSDGLILLDGNDCIVAINSPAEHMLGLPSAQIIGKPIAEFLPTWEQVVSQRPLHDTTAVRRTLYYTPSKRYLEMQVNRLKSKTQGKIILLRDVTQQRITREARQEAREALLIYLHSLHNLLQDASTITEFLEKAIYQTTYTFNLDSAFIALLDKSGKQNPKFVLAAQNGIIAQIFPHLNAILPPKLIEEMRETKEPHIISDISELDEILSEQDPFPRPYSIAFFPFMAEGEFLGIMALGRMSVNGFDSYDIMRLGIAVEEIASEVLKERQKQKQIALMERQRLVSDLHDSITQQLYGLVTVTEAIQLGLQTGAIEKVKHLFPQLNAGARQALREMRLFLYELNPIDLEKEGLLEAIRLRLASVEERSSIRARFVHRGHISLPKETEVALYYIVEESLNNALKHAQATEILVKLENRRGKLYLQIVDNGIGFRQENVRPGGKGIENMKLRASQIGATFRISSGQKGTRVSVSLPIHSSPKRRSHAREDSDSHR